MTDFDFLREIVELNLNSFIDFIHFLDSSWEGLEAARRRTDMNIITIPMNQAVSRD
jgi:hypothetical protein